ncbi:hypothetical protein JHK82_039458 [Glycine max]|uniref:VPS37 C-terminal domain-containing protein n=1 Tax=Glycine max TaxID=3847 RepID=A0A0R0GNX9_SOYBN|nr:hypothetical protein JHK87_039435 [Glycine soja]KAG4962773.1 hypothetical protein JHK86_039641 [Glycine max]KAG4965241.1 hypothetical protein JHK85_040216 [Glycine max]KAG5110235.1 hypothetical protein JHK82_039458 [Glycine max]KAG5121523.1 hypothetical protein JHK84_039863 [Glycine max]
MVEGDRRRLARGLRRRLIQRRPCTVVELREAPTLNAFFVAVNDDLCKENLQLADENLQKEPCIVELRNQNKIICTTELAMAQQKLNGLEKQKEEMMKLNSPQYLLQWIQEAMNKTEVEYENLHQQVLQRDIDIGAFLQKYKQLRTAYHRKSLVHLAARTSNI